MDLQKQKGEERTIKELLTVEKSKLEGELERKKAKRRMTEMEL